MMKNPFDVIIVGAGAGGPVAAKELGEKGLKVLLLEAGPWYGHKKWPHPNSEAGAASANQPEELSPELLTRSFTDYEGEMNDTLSGKFRWGPADRSRTAWSRNLTQAGFCWQNSGVGGTTLHYFGNSPRAYPAAIDQAWPISYRELLPYYEQVEATLPVQTAPMTAKEELFFYAAQKAGWPLLKTRDVTSAGYRPQPNAILPPDPNINNPAFTFNGQKPGCTLCGHCVNGCRMGPTVEQTAKRSTLVSYIPLALQTRAVTVMPNTFVTKVLTTKQNGKVRAVGVAFRHTWTGNVGEARAKVVILAGGSIETPRLWLASGLPANPWVGKGLTTHYFDCLTGIFEANVLQRLLGTPAVEAYIGQNSAARFDHPGLGVIQGLGLSPSLFAGLIYTMSGAGFQAVPKAEDPWEVIGRAVGEQFKELMLEYPRSLSMLIFTDDQVQQQNGLTLHPLLKDEHGPIPVLSYQPSQQDRQKRDRLAVIAAEMLKKIGAKKIIRTDCVPGAFVHLESTMRMGYVVDANCESLQVQGLFVADNSVHFNSLGGPNPTLTTQALAARTAEKLAAKYFA